MMRNKDQWMHLIEPRTWPVGGGTVRRLLPHHSRRMVGPFIFADLIGPETIAAGEGIDVDAHPHIGLATVTYLFAGRLVHRDSTGVVQTIDPGAVNWMSAGAGVTHTERTHPDDRAVSSGIHGLQTWVALPDGAENDPPGFDHAGADDLPVFSTGGSSVRVVAGSGLGHSSPVPASSPLILAEVTLADRSPVSIGQDHPELAVLAVTDGVMVNDRPLSEGTLAVLGEDSTNRLGGRGRAIILGGEPVGPRHIWWNFVHSDPERIESAKEDWRLQRFPTVPDDHDPWVPLPG